MNCHGCGQPGEDSGLGFHCCTEDACPITTFPSEPVVALFVSDEGPYVSDPRFDAYGPKRNAFTCTRKAAAVCHPECKRWGRMARGSPGHQRFEVGDDGGQFEFCLCWVRENGGVIEGPQGSHAWPWFRLPLPPRRGWSPQDEFGGRSCRIDQGAYGHPAKKATWLYGVLPIFPELDWSRVWGRPYIGGDGYHGKAERDRAKASTKGVQKVPQVPREWNWRTPEALKEALYEMAASCHGWQPRRLAIVRPLLQGAAGERHA